MDTIEVQKEAIFQLLKKFITEVVGEEFAEEMDIKEDSTFTKDLEMDSIEIVSFAEKVKANYDDSIDFQGWLSELEMEQLVELRIIDIVNFIVDASNSDK